MGSIREIITMVEANDLNIYMLAFNLSVLLDSISADAMHLLSIIVYSVHIQACRIAMKSIFMV